MTDVSQSMEIASLKADIQHLQKLNESYKRKIDSLTTQLEWIQESIHATVQASKERIMVDGTMATFILILTILTLLTR